MPERADQLSGFPRSPGGTGFLLGLFAALVVFAALDYSLGHPAIPPPLQARFQRAARAVLPSDEGAGGIDSAASASEGGSFKIPVSQQYNRREALQIVLDLDSRRRQAASLLTKAIALQHAGVRESVEGGQLEQLVVLARNARQQLTSFLGVNSVQAAALLYGFGWPWHHSELGDPNSARGALRIGDLPAPLRRESDDDLDQILARARNSSGWSTAKPALRSQFGLSEEQVQAVRAHLCRRSLAAVFGGFPEGGSARDALEKSMNLTGAQNETVVAMAGALYLTSNGTRAYPALIWLLERRPDLAKPLLRRCTRMNRIRHQAELAVSQLQGPQAQEATRELLALGPFGAWALQKALGSNDFQPRELARQILQDIREIWPSEGPPLETLGADPGSWERWHTQAKDFL